MIDQEDKEDDASLADASDGDEVTFERGHCGSTTLLELCEVLPASTARNAVLELLERCCRPVDNLRDDDLRLEDQRASAENASDQRVQSRPRRRFARFLGLGAPAQSVGSASRAAQGLVIDLGEEASEKLLAFASTMTRGW